MEKSNKKSNKKKKADLKFIEEEMILPPLFLTLKTKVIDADQFLTPSTERELLKVQKSMMKTIFDSVVKFLSDLVDGAVKQRNK